MISLTPNQINNFIKLQNFAVRGKEKFIEQLMTRDLCAVRNGRNRIAMDSWYDPRLGDMPMYMTLWTPRIELHEVLKYMETGVYDNGFMLSFHVRHDSWYYAMCRTFAMNELPEFLREYIHTYHFEELYNDKVFKTDGQFYGTCKRNYAPLLSKYNELRSLVFSDMGHHIQYSNKFSWVERQLHPQGEYIKYFVNTVSPLSYAEILPAMGDDALFNANIMNVDDNALFNMIDHAQYCNPLAPEVMSRTLSQQFWGQCERYL